MFTTSAPACAAPVANASASPGELGRMSCPTTTVVAATDLDEGGTRATGELLVELVGHDAADVVGLEDGADARGIQAAHASDSSASRAPGVVSRW